MKEHFTPLIEQIGLSVSNSDYISFSIPVTESEIEMANNNRTLKELAASDVTYQPLSIQYPDLDIPFELKYGLIHLLPKFQVLPGEDPHKHLKESHIVCSTMRPQGIPKEHIKMRAFPFLLDYSAKDGLYYLQPGAVTCWNDMKKLVFREVLPCIQNCSNEKRNMWYKTEFWRVFT